MKLILAAALLLCLATPTPCQGIERTPRQIEAVSEINEGAREYKASKFYEAQKRFERALELDPSNKNAPFFIARAIQSQFKPGVDTAENLALARSAIAAYHRALNSEPSNEEGYNAILYLYGQIKDETAQRQLLTARIADPQVPDVKRSQASTLMASKEWNCSYTITERKEHKRVVNFQGRALVKYLKPKDEAEFYEAKQCAERGLEWAEQAVALDANSEQAWAYKTNLLLELVKLAEMEENDQLKFDYQKQAVEAQRRTTELSAQQEERRKAEAQNNQTPHPQR